MNHIAIIDTPGLNDTWGWFCWETPKGNCTLEGFEYPTREDAVAAASASGHRVATEGEYPGRFDGIPGLMWYATVARTLGRDLKEGDWLDSLDHRGARAVTSVLWACDDTREVYFNGGDRETVNADVLYDVVDPDSQVQPDGSPL